MQLLFSCKCEKLLVITGNVSGYVFICTSCVFLVIVIEFDQKFMEMELLVVLFIVVLKIKIESLKLLWGAPTFVSLSMCLLQAFEISLKNVVLYYSQQSQELPIV